MRNFATMASELAPGVDISDDRREPLLLIGYWKIGYTRTGAHSRERPAGRNPLADSLLPMSTRYSGGIFLEPAPPVDTPKGHEEAAPNAVHPGQPGRFRHLDSTGFPTLAPATHVALMKTVSTPVDRCRVPAGDPYRTMVLCAWVCYATSVPVRCCRLPRVGDLSQTRDALEARLASSSRTPGGPPMNTAPISTSPARYGGAFSILARRTLRRWFGMGP